MRYDIYPTINNNLVRFSLGRSGRKPLIVIGLNPSVATEKEPDHTITRIENFGASDGWSGFVVFNLYPLRSTSPDNLPSVPCKELMSRNRQEIAEWIEKLRPTAVWAAWGDHIEKRDYLVPCLDDIVKAVPSEIQWQHRGTLTKKFNPRHPSRLSNTTTVHEFNVRDYLSTKMKAHSSP